MKSYRNLCLRPNISIDFLFWFDHFRDNEMIEPTLFLMFTQNIHFWSFSDWIMNIIFCWEWSWFSWLKNNMISAVDRIFNQINLTHRSLATLQHKIAKIFLVEINFPSWTLTRRNKNIWHLIITSVKKGEISNDKNGILQQQIRILARVFSISGEKASETWKIF